MGFQAVDLFQAPPVDGADAVHLTLVDRLPVRFTGERSRSGPLTIGQATAHGWILQQEPHDQVIPAPLPVPAGARLDDIVAVLGILLAQHESLRTTFDLSDRGTQRVAGSGELTVEVYRDDGGATPDAALVEELFRRLRAAEFDAATDLPVRVAVVADANTTRVAAATFYHLAIDLAGVALLGREFATMLADPARRRVGPRGHQPLDQAAAERSPGGRRRAEATSRYWADLMRSMPQCNFPLPHQDREPGGATSGWLWSRAAALALPHVMARTATGGSTAVLAALCAVLAARTGQPHCVLQTLSSNRFERRLRDYVGTLATDALVSVEVTTPGFDELVGRTATAILRAGRYSAIEPVEMAWLEAITQRERGTTYGRYCTFNDSTMAFEPEPAAALAPGDPAAAAAALGETVMWWRDWPNASESLGFRLLRKEDILVLGVVAKDRSRTGPTEIELLLRGVERLLVAAATGDVGFDRLTEVTGVPPMPMGPQWTMVDRSWVELREVRRLLADAVGSPLARVFAVPGEPGGTVLAAYLPTGRVATPREAHDACVARLPGRSTAMAPHRYVICDRAPDDPDRLAAWHGRPVLASGDGR